MKKGEARMDKLFTEAAQTLHESGHDWFYLDEVGAQMVREKTLDSERFMKGYNFFRKILGFAGLRLTLTVVPVPEDIVAPTKDRLADRGEIESAWEPPNPETPSYHPQRRVYRLVEGEACGQQAAATLMADSE